MDLHSDDSSDDSSGPFDDGSSSEACLSMMSSNRFFQYPSDSDFDSDTRVLKGSGSDAWLRNLNDEEWEKLGRNITYQSRVEIRLNEGALNDHKMSFFCRGLRRHIMTNSITKMNLYENGLSAAAAQSMVPFLQNANFLKELYLSHNNFQSEGFNIMFLALRDSPIHTLSCNYCGIEAIEIDSEHIPKHLTTLRLRGNRINADGCRQLSKLLQGGDSTLKRLFLRNNKIDDDGVAILVDALQNNASLQILDLMSNEGIFAEGRKLCLKLVNDVSSITATLQSNRTLQELNVKNQNDQNDMLIQQHINKAAHINAENENDAEAAGKEKVIETQLHSVKRAELAELQGVTRSFYSEINPLHLPEVLALAGRHHGQGELYVALKSSIAGVISTVNRKQWLQQQRAHHNAIIAEHRTKVGSIEAELAAIEAADGPDAVDIGSDSRCSKRRRKWWWGLWGEA